MNDGDCGGGCEERERESGVQEPSCQASTSATASSCGRTVRGAHPDEFGRAVARVAAAQICQAVGFEGVAQSALDGLSDVVVRYVSDVGKSANYYASLCCRRESNLFDIVKALEDLEGSERSGFVREMVEFVESKEEVPFTQPIPRFPVVKEVVEGLDRGSSLEEGKEKEKGVSMGKHMPDWLPAFPEPHTYIQTPMWNGRSTNVRVDKLELVKQRRRAERSLINLQQRLLSNVLAEPSSVGHSHGNVNVQNGMGASYPSHAPQLALPAGERAVVKAIYEDGEKKPLSAMETFAPALEAMRDGGVSDAMDVDRTEVEKRKPVVQFKLRAGRKLLVEDLDVNLRSKMNGRKQTWLERLDGREEKKTRAELILRQSMEPPQELSQM